MVQCALEGYEVHAFGFVTKPLQYETFRRTIMDALHSLAQRTGVAIALKGRDDVVVYHSNNILYFEVYGRILNVVTQTETREFVVPMKEIEQQVEGLGFFRCHKSFLINCQYVKQIGANSLLMVDGREIPLSKHRKNEFLAEFSRYVRGAI
jgi:DNA-binding LytR/AlgR family response regulator